MCRNIWARSTREEMQKWEEVEKGPGKARASTSQGMKGIDKSFEPWWGNGYESRR